MENKSANVTELSERILQGIRKALRKLVEVSAANGESLVIGDKDGKIRMVPAKDLLNTFKNRLSDHPCPMPENLNSVKPAIKV